MTASDAAKSGQAASAAAAVAESTLRVDAARIDAVMNLVGELIIGKSMLNRALTEFDQRHSRDPLRAKLSDAMGFQSRVLDELHKCVLKIRMVPVEQLFRRFPRLVRDVAKQCGKDVALDVSGQNTDLDKGILDSLAEPLMHLVRNAVDHGIEHAEERITAGKPARGTIYLNAYHQGTQVVIEVRDDGRGIDLAHIRQQAVEEGILKADEAAAPFRLRSSQPHFRAWFQHRRRSHRSLRPRRRHGRRAHRAGPPEGHGAYLLRKKARHHDSTSRSADAGEHSDAALPRRRPPLCGPSLFRRRDLRASTSNEIHRIDRREVLRLREQVLTLVRLEQSEPHSRGRHRSPKKKKHFVIVIGAAEKRFGLLVDSLVGEEELVIKALPSRHHLQRSGQRRFDSR